jgi:hypothetical protein
MHTYTIIICGCALLSACSGIARREAASASSAWEMMRGMPAGVALMPNRTDVVSISGGVQHVLYPASTLSRPFVTATAFFSTTPAADSPERGR